MQAMVNFCLGRSLTKQGIFPDLQTLLSVKRILLEYDILGLIGYHFSIKYNSKYKIHYV